TAQHLGQSLGTVPFLVQFADLAGPYGVGAVLLVSNALLYEAWRSRGRARALALLAWTGMAAAVLGYDGWAWTHPPRATGVLRVAFVQRNASLDDTMDSDKDDDGSRRLAELTERAAKERPDLVLWPETARPAPILHRPEAVASYAMPEVQALARRLGTTIVT